MDSSLAKPSRIGSYDIVDVIGRGGMGIVYKGTDPRIGRSVAIKVLTAAADDPDLLLRFYREAKYTGSLQHQNIVTVYELGHHDGVPYLVMEYLEGISLDGLIASGRPLPMAEKLGIILQVCSGLTYAHKRDLVHRDIKPANIMILDNGTAKIVDFGIARLGGHKLTRTGHVVGSLNYMSPEQLSGNTEVDLRTDVYSTGVVLFQLLTGVLPFDAGTTAGTLKKIVQDPPPRLSEYMQDCPHELEAIVVKVLAKNRDERYSTAEDFAVELAGLQQQYERQMLAENLQHAADALKRGDFAGSRQNVLQVLRIAPQNTEASDLLRQIKLGQEQQQREQQALQLQMKAEEAFRKNEHTTALQYIEQGLQLDSGRTVFLSLRDAIFEAQAKMSRYREALKRAETALRSADLEGAKRSIDDAIEILPDDPECKRLASLIAARIEQHLREQRAAQQQRQLAITVNAVEKAMADARMQLFLGQLDEASAALASVEGEVSKLPPRWAEQVNAIKREINAKREEGVKPAAVEWNEPLRDETGDMPASHSATVLFQSPVAPQPSHRFDEPSGPQPGQIPAPAYEPQASPFQDHNTHAGPISVPRRWSSDETRHAEVAPELREFLEPEKPKWPRHFIWVGLGALLLVPLIVWLLVRPKPQAETPKPHVAATSSYTYAEINAEPWGKISDVSPASGDASNAIGSETPLRLKLPPGHYTLTLEGPNHEQKRVDVTVPAQGGTSAFTVFRKPDLKRLVGE